MFNQQHFIVNQEAEQEKPAISHDINALFPIFLKMESLRLLIVGGGLVGYEKLKVVLEQSPQTNIILVAKEISLAIRSLAVLHPALILVEKAFDASDLNGVDVVIIAINNKQVSSSIIAISKAAGKLVNAADQPALCDFYFGAVVQKGSIKIAVSTNGKSPTIAKRLKEAIAGMIPDEMELVLNDLKHIRKNMQVPFEEKVRQLNDITSILVEDGSNLKQAKTEQHRWKRITTYSVVAFALMLIGHFIFSYIPLQAIANGAVDWYATLDPNFHWMMVAGFIAQMVDGALGMGYGVTSAAILLSTGINPAAISGSIHTAEMFSSGASGYSHYRFGNVNKKLFKVLVIPGIIGAIIGAILLVFLGEKYGNYIRPVMALYTLFLGIKIFANAFRKQQPLKKFKQYGSLAGLGGFLDSFGGGGWGPIVTTTLITKGRSPRFVIGTVSLTEFFVTLASAFTFFTLIGVSHWQTIVALIIGGFIAAPIAAKLTGKLPRKTSFILLGILVIVWSLKILSKLL
ncbi:MAG: TSUP family transporter [Ferruginibacter sp.]